VKEQALGLLETFKSKGLEGLDHEAEVIQHTGFVEIFSVTPITDVKLIDHCGRILQLGKKMNSHSYFVKTPYLLGHILPAYIMISYQGHKEYRRI
jgi:hypothetical protein